MAFSVTLMTAQCGTLCMTWSVDLYAPSCLACIMTAAHVPVCVLPMLLGHCSGVGAAAAAAAMAAALLRQLGEVEGHCTCAKHQTSCD